MAVDAKTEAENKTYYIKAGDRWPHLEITLYNEDGSVRGLLGVTDIKLIVSSSVAGRRLVDAGAMTIFGADADGTVQYAWAADELKAGTYMMEVVIDPGGENQESFPKGGYYKLVVIPHL